MKSRVSEVSLRTLSSPLLSDDVNPSDLSSLSDSLTLDDGKCPTQPYPLCEFTPPSHVLCSAVF